MRTFLVIAVLAAAVRADPPDGLTFVRVNEQGAEEWVRACDGAYVVRVPAGDYLRRPYEGGTAAEEPKPFPVRSFFIDKHEVTNARFARFLNAAPKPEAVVRLDVPGIEKTASGWRAQPALEHHPVTATTGFGAQEYARWVGGRLPRPTEWEKAAGGPEGLLYPWGDDAPDGTRANFGRPRPRGTMPVGSFAAGASPYGCLDMAGNAYERVLTRGGPVMIKGGAWLSPHPLNLRVLDLCMQPMEVADRSVGFRCVMPDPEEERPSRKRAEPAALALAVSFEEAVAEAKRRRVPIFLTLHFDTCGQCDRTRAQLFTDPRFIAYCNAHMVVAAGCRPAPQYDVDPHPENADGTCPLFPGLACRRHYVIFKEGLEVVGVFRTSPGNFVLHPDRCEKGAGAAAVLAGEVLASTK
jgi:formylglycine-generating enzyme required for sulfatase activity